MPASEPIHYAQDDLFPSMYTTLDIFCCRYPHNDAPIDLVYKPSHQLHIVWMDALSTKIDKDVFFHDEAICLPKSAENTTPDNMPRCFVQSNVSILQRRLGSDSAYVGESGAVLHQSDVYISTIKDCFHVRLHKPGELRHLHQHADTIYVLCWSPEPPAEDACRVFDSIEFISHQAAEMVRSCLSRSQFEAAAVKIGDVQALDEIAASSIPQAYRPQTWPSVAARKLSGWKACPREDTARADSI